MDSFALPVEGTETRVNAQAQAYEYMTAYIEAAKQVSLGSAKSKTAPAFTCGFFLTLLTNTMHATNFKEL